MKKLRLIPHRSLATSRYCMRIAHKYSFACISTFYSFPCRLSQFRKGGMLANNALGIAGGLLMGLAKPCSSFELLILGRLVIGFNCGLNTALVPMYLLEISPLPLRGGLGTVSQVGVTVGMLLSQILGLPVILGTKDGWPYLLGE